MDMPPSGWYPDPYGMPGLLRWWDGSAWTQHTHEGAAADFSDASGPATMLDATRIGQPPAAQPTTIQPAIIAPATGQPTSAQPPVRPVDATTVQPTIITPQVRPVDATTVQPTIITPQVRPGDATMVVNPAWGAASAAATEPYGGLRPTRVQRPVPADASMDPTQTMRPAQGGGGANSSWPNAGSRQGAGSSWPNAGPAGDHATQVLPMDPVPWDSPSGPGRYAERASRYGYHRDQRRRRLLLAGLLAGGTAVALGLIALVVASLGSSGSVTPKADQTNAPAATTAPATTPTVQATSATPTATPTPSVSPLPAGVADSVSGLSYSLLSSPWATGCPGSLSSQQTLTWTAGEAAIAGQFTNNGQQVTWYGEACSGPLTQQYGYSGVSDLEPVTMNLVNQFDGPYYGALNHQRTQLASIPVSVSGHPGWEVKYLETYPYAASMGLPFNSEEAAVVVVDQGNGGPPAVFFVSVPSNLGVTWVDSFVGSLALTPTATPTTSATPTATSPPTPPQPGGNGGNGRNGGNGGNGGNNP